MKIVFEKYAQKQFLSLDKAVQVQIKKFILKLENMENPRQTGKSLSGKLKNYWRYRVGNYRLICKILDDELIITVVALNHRNKIYKLFKNK